jgi:DNA-binding LytR/AlgR family response regulator
MLRIAICDDKIDELSTMVQLIDLYRTSKNVNCEYAAFPNGVDLVAALEKGMRFDICCLDIIMPGFLGTDVAWDIRTRDKAARIVFFTSSREHALESYSVKAVNYILKPITKEKLFLVFDEMLDRMQTVEDEDKIIVKSIVGIQKILISHLVFAEALNHNVLYHLKNGSVIKCYESFSGTCDTLLKYGCFIRTHRSYLVNMRYIQTIENKQIILKVLSPVPIAKSTAVEIKKQYLAYYKERTDDANSLGVIE